MITKNLTLWLGKQEKQLFVPVSQYDDMWQFVFSIVNDSVPWSIPDSAQVTLNGIKPDGNVFAVYGTVSGGTATVDCTNQMTAVAGLVECELSILDSSKVVGTANFFLAVEQAPKADDAVVSESTLAAYGEVLDQISQYAAGFIPDAVKSALLNCFEHVAWIDEHGQDYYDALATVLAQKTVVSISAVYTQSGTVYATDSLDSLKTDLVVTATYDDTSTADVTAYVTLSGTLTVGTSTITVTYEGKTGTFSVVVSRYVLYDYIYNTNTSFTDNNSWIETGLTYSPSFNILNIEFEAENNNSTTSTAALICANNQTTSDTGNIVWYGRSSKAGFSAYNLGQAKQLSSVPGDTRATIKYFFVDGGESYMQWGETTVAVATMSKSSVSTNNVGLILAGGYGFSDGTKYSMKRCKLGYIKFTDPSTNALVYHFIPAYDTVTTKYGYYEAVNGVFYPDNATYLSCGNWGS